MSTKEMLRKLRDDYKLYFRKCLKIRNKNSEIVPFVTNPSQDKLIKIVEDWKAKYPDERTRPTLYIIILKARQLGFSTATEGIFFHDLHFSYNTVAMIVSFDDDSATTINDMSDRFYQYLPQFLKPARRMSRAKGIIFENPRFNPQIPEGPDNKPGLQNKFLIETARNLNAGSSYTINRLHISELAKWNNPEQTMTSLMQAVPDYGAIVIVESTAQGFDYFQSLWDKAEHSENNFVPLFVAWHEHSHYRATYKGFTLTKTEQGLKQLYGLDNDQLQWRRNTIKDKLNGDEELFKQEYPSCPSEAFLTTGRPVFDVAKVIARKEELKRLYEQQKPFRGSFIYDYENDKIVDSSIKLVEDTNGFVTIYEQPQANYPYIVGGDIAEGGADFSAGQVENNVTCNQAAVWHGHLDTDLYSKQMYCLGKYYNDALLAIEANFDLHPQKELPRLGYKKLFKREVIDEITKQKQHKFGFMTTSVTRPVIIAKTVEFVRDNIELINDIPTLDEMLRFVRNNDGKPEAMEGYHDDLVLAKAICRAAREQQSMIVQADYVRPRPKYNVRNGRTGY